MSDAQITALIYIIIFLYGIIIGSFLNVCIFRIPKKESIVPGSHCMSCGQKLCWYDMVPIFSYLLLRGRCRRCGAKISAQYPVVEAVNGLLYLTVFMACGFEISSILYCLMTSALIVIAVIDERTFEIPPSLNLFLLGVGILMCVYDRAHLLSHIIGLICVSLFLFLLYVLSSGRAIGGGDIKLMAAAGLILGWKKIILAFLCACIVGSVIHLLRMRFGNGKHELAMGPYLSVGIFVSALWGDLFLSWYLSCLGL